MLGIMRSSGASKQSSITEQNLKVSCNCEFPVCKHAVRGGSGYSVQFVSLPNPC